MSVLFVVLVSLLIVTSIEFSTNTTSSSCILNTQFYGATVSTANKIDATDQQKIIEISSWGTFSSIEFAFNGAIGNFTWNAASQNVVGIGSNFESCIPFILDIDDYINGYRIIYDQYIYGLYFYTFKNKSYHCIDDIVNLNHYIDSGFIYYDNYYLSGFVFDAGWVIDAISFEFSSMDRSCIPTPRIPMGDKICISRSLLPSTNGEYIYSSWDVNDYGPIYYNSDSNQYLYPWRHSPSTTHLYISSDSSSLYSSSWCDISSPNAIVNPTDCFNHWYSWTNDSWVNNQWTQDTNLRLVGCNDICISGNEINNKSWLDGRYIWSHFDSAINSSVYYCQECNQFYLYGFIYSESKYYWKLGSDYSSEWSDTDCYLGNNLGSNYVFDLNDCKYWETIKESAWMNFTGIQVNECNNASNSSIIPNQQRSEYPTSAPTKSPTIDPKSTDNKICISGSSKMNGSYEYFDWDSNKQGSIYYNSKKNQYLYPWIDSATNNNKYLVSDHPFTNLSIAYCNIPSTENIFNPHSCFDDWYSKINDQWVFDANLRSVTCNDICISGSEYSHLNGIYNWSHFNKSVNSSVYFCQSCQEYLYGYIYADAHNWRVGLDYTGPQAIAACTVGYRKPPYTFNLHDCDEWHVVKDEEFVDDPDMMVNECMQMTTTTQIPSINPIGTPTIEPTMNPSIEPTLEPTANPTKNPSEHPTRSPFSTDNIIITTHDNIGSSWIAFNVSNMDLSCGGTVISVEITDESSYDNKWINYSININKYYEFNNFHQPFSIPISMKITKMNGNNKQSIEGKNVIYIMEGGMDFDFGDNFCILETKDIPKETNPIDWTFCYVIVIIVSVFIVIGGIAYLNGKCCRENDHFKISAILSFLIQLLDMLSDVFFVITVYATYETVTTHIKIQLLWIWILSVIFIVVPVGISLYQLYVTSNKEWIHDNRVREWFKLYVQLLYVISIFSGSSFSAMKLFNSNMFSLSIFNMGLNNKHLFSFSTKKLYSIILFENCPQLVLSIWYTLLLGELNYVPAIQMVFSLISIFDTIIIIIQKRIYNTQDFVYITIDITGHCVMNNIKICKNRINEIKSFLCESVLAVNPRSVEIQRPYIGSLVNGVRLQIYISRIHDGKHLNLADDYEDLLENAVNDGSLGNVIKETWQLSSFPNIENIECQFAALVRDEAIQNQSATNIACDDDDDDEKEQLNHSNVLENWHQITAPKGGSTICSTAIDGIELERYTS